MANNVTLAISATSSSSTTQIRGDADFTLSATDSPVQYITAALTAKRTVTLPSTGLTDGLEFTIINNYRPTVEAPVTGGNGTIYYVDAVNGVDTNNGTSQATAWKTIDKVATRSATTAFQPGDQILFKRGQAHTTAVYNTITMAGTVGSPVLIDAYGTGANPTLENTNAGPFMVAFKLAGTYCTVQNLTIIKTNPVPVGGGTTNTTEIGIYLSGTGMRVTRCDISGVGEGVYMTGTAHRVDHCYIHDCYMVTADVTANNDYGASGIIVSACTNSTIDHNRIYRMRKPSPDYTEDGSGVEMFEACSGIEIKQNIFYDCNTVCEVGASVSTRQNLNTLFHHNLCYGPTMSGFVLHNLGTFQADIQNFKIEHNTFYRIGPGKTADTVIIFNTTAVASQYYFRNNVVKWYNTSQLFYNCQNIIHTNNIYMMKSVGQNNGGGVAMTFDATEISTGDIDFVNEAGGNFHLNPHSSALAQGANLSYTVDLEDHPLPTALTSPVQQNTSHLGYYGLPTMGAYEVHQLYGLEVYDPISGAIYNMEGGAARVATFRATSTTDWRLTKMDRIAI